MKSYLIIPLSVLLMVTASACDSDKDHYSGLSEMVAERNEARRAISDKNVRKKEVSGQVEDRSGDKMSSREVSGKEADSGDISAGILYERQIEIVDSQSGTPLAKGVAFMNKKGRIVKIKIEKD